MSEQWCPQCHRTYAPTYADPNEGTSEDREQHISGICSDACWDHFLHGERNKKWNP